jgi:nucleotide-binding universal stress UspA family protein
MLRARAGELRYEAERLLGEMQIKWNFLIKRGSVAEEIQKAAQDVDLLVMARSTMSHRRLGSTARELAQSLPVTLLLIEPAPTQYPDLITLYDGSEKSLRAIETAARIAGAQGATLTIAIIAETNSAAKALKKELSTWLQKRDIEARFRWLIPPQPDKLGQMIGIKGQCMLVLPEGNPLLEQQDISEILSDLDCPVFLVS